MYRDLYLPEGALLNTAANRAACENIAALHAAMEKHTILEGIATMCDTAHNLMVRVGAYTGVIPRLDAAIGIDSGKTRDIAVISRVGKPVAFHITGIETNPNGTPFLRLSRKSAQQEALRFFLGNLVPGDVIPARVTHLEPFGAFVDIGCGNVALIGIEHLSVSRISHPKDRFRVGQDLYAAVLELNLEEAQVTLTHRELLGTWDENVAKFEPGQTVRGVVRGVEEYGVFVELAPNLSGLAEKKEGLSEGDAVSVFIKNINREKMKIKLIVIDVFGKEEETIITPEDYYITNGRLTRWDYSPSICGKKKIETVF